jgi:predicted nucleotidyltransferase
MKQKNIEELKELLTINLKDFVKNYNIKLIYIFGSYAKGSNNSKSDLDIAILLNNNYNPLDKLSLIGDLTSIFKRDDIDLVLLNSANSVLKHQVIKYGKLVFMENEDIKVDFEVKVLKEYMDMEPFRKTQMKYINEWIEDSVGVDK